MNVDKNLSGLNVDYYVFCFEWYNWVLFEVLILLIRVWGNDELILK